MELIKIDSKDWLINQKRVPLPDSVEYTDFYDFHEEICKNGCMMGNVYIPPFLYWHLNMWHTEVDVIDSFGRISQKYANPSLRDNEWVVANEIDRAEKARKGLVILGIRRFAIMLSDYQLGQVFQLGTAHWTQWRAGDCITWEWQDVPHATCNMGWWDRPMLQVTGNVTQVTLDLLARASPDLVINL